MHHPDELYKLKLKDIKFEDKLCWLHISSFKTDQSANRNFISIEYTDSCYCSIKLLRSYLLIRLKTTKDEPLFLLRQEKQLTVKTVGTIVKRIARNTGAQGRFTTYSIRIGGATAAMKAGLSLTQIRTIGGWDSKAVMLYLRSVGTTELKISRRMGFAN
ncbi:6267_t:CDS:1 [Cetraspora pellucida]|uniref:6267_t:CDS:1 n=1 Tax=Cetraspora pellucida TaxID=1433469 RepID=A0A9N9A4H9_9GLOM|nr:6267_t:CDS:1 [Cetraspora pellucida]